MGSNNSHTLRHEAHIGNNSAIGCRASHQFPLSHERSPERWPQRTIKAASPRNRFHRGVKLASITGWAVPNTQARVAQAATGQVDTFQMMTGAKQLPSEHFADFTFVY